MKELDRFREKIYCLPEGAREAEAQAEREGILSAEVSGGQPAGASASDQTSLFVRVSGDRTGLVYTQKLKDDPEEIMKKAYENSLYSGAREAEPMHDAASAGFRMSEPELAHTAPGDLKALAADLEKAVRYEAGDLSHSKVTVTETLRTMGLVNSKGCDVTSGRRNVEACISLVREGRDGHYVFDEVLSSPTPEGITAGYFIGQLDRWRETQLPTVSLAPGEYRVVLDASVMCNILNTAWQMFSAPYYLTKNTPLAGRLGDKVFSDAISVTDAPVIPGSGYQFPFDCEGSRGVESILVDGGGFTGLLQTLASARQMGAATTGNAGRKTLLSGVIHTAVTAMPKNFRLMPGNCTREELIQTLCDGLYIHESYDVFHSVNVASGVFTIPCKAVVVRNGRMTGVAEGLTINGNVVELLSQTECVSSDARALPMVMLKSYTVSSPSVLVSRLRVSGGA